MPSLSRTRNKVLRVFYICLQLIYMCASIDQARYTGSRLVDIHNDLLKRQAPPALDFPNTLASQYKDDTSEDDENDDKEPEKDKPDTKPQNQESRNFGQGVVFPSQDPRLEQADSPPSAGVRTEQSDSSPPSSDQSAIPIDASLELQSYRLSNGAVAAIIITAAIAFIALLVGAGIFFRRLENGIAAEKERQKERQARKSMAVMRVANVHPDYWSQIDKSSEGTHETQTDQGGRSV